MLRDQEYYIITIYSRRIITLVRPEALQVLIIEQKFLLHILQHHLFQQRWIHRIYLDTISLPPLLPFKGLEGNYNLS